MPRVTMDHGSREWELLSAVRGLGSVLETEALPAGQKGFQGGIYEDKEGPDLRSGQMQMLRWRRMDGWTRMKDQ